MAITEDPSDQRLRNVNPESGMQEAYLVLSEKERARGFVQPVRYSYIHLKCGTVTRINTAIAETYARKPAYYGATYCASCKDHFPVGEKGEFIWEGTTIKVGTHGEGSGVQSGRHVSYLAGPTPFAPDGGIKAQQRLEIPASPQTDLRSELKSVLNRHSAENGSNTPDHVLADFLLRALAALDEAVEARSAWYGRRDVPGIRQPSGSCYCREPWTLGVLHRQDGPCYQPAPKMPSDS